jgi:hypothetical protein
MRSTLPAPTDPEGNDIFYQPTPSSSRTLLPNMPDPRANQEQHVKLHNVNCAIDEQDGKTVSDENVRRRLAHSGRQWVNTISFTAS